MQQSNDVVFFSLFLALQSVKSPMIVISPTVCLVKLIYMVVVTFVLSFCSEEQRGQRSNQHVESPLAGNEQQEGYGI